MRSYPGLSSEAMLYAARGNKEQGPDVVRNILIGKAVNSVGNMLLDAFEPAQRKKEEEKDFGDRTRDFARGALNVGTGLAETVLLARGLGVLNNQPKGAAQGEAQNFNEQPPSSPPPRPGAAETAPSQTEGYAPFGKLQNEPALTERTSQDKALGLAAITFQERLNDAREELDQKNIPTFIPTPEMVGNYVKPEFRKDLTSAERTRQGEELVKAARAERMPGLVVTDLNSMVDEDRLNRIRGIRPKLDKELTQKRLTDEMMGYPSRSVEALMQRIEEPSDYAKGVAAGMEAMTMRKLQSQAPSQTIDVTFTDEERRSTPYTVPARSSNPLLSREPMGFNETFGVKGGVPMARSARKEEDEESLANFYASLPTDPSTGERQLNFATKYLADKGSIDPETVMVVDPEVDTPRNSGGLLQGQLRGETLYNQQENREPFVQDQQMDAINSVDEQGPGFKSNRTAAEVLQNTLNKTMEQLSQKETPAFAPTPEMVGSYVKPEFRAVSEKPSVKERLRSAGIGMQGVPVDFGGEGIGLYVDREGMNFNYDSLSQEGAQRQLKRAGVSEKEASDYWMGNLKSMGVLDRAAEDPEMIEEAKRYQEQKARAEQYFANRRGAKLRASRTLDTEEATPTVKKTTIIEETVPAAQTRMSPFEASEKLRRIQTSGRPTARQEAQDFLQSIKGQMIDG